MGVIRRQQPIMKASPMANILSSCFLQFATLAKFLCCFRLLDGGVMEVVVPTAFLFLERPDVPLVPEVVAAELPLLPGVIGAAEWPLLPGVIGDAIPSSIHKQTEKFKSERRKKGLINITDYRQMGFDDTKIPIIPRSTCAKKITSHPIFRVNLTQIYAGEGKPKTTSHFFFARKCTGDHTMCSRSSFACQKTCTNSSLRGGMMLFGARLLHQ